MIRYVALLRGINVGGHNVKMATLRDIFTELGFDNVSSYINSGNIFFDAATRNKERLRNRIEQRLSERLGYEVPTFLRTLNELESILAQQPFKDIELTDDTRFSVVFSHQPLNTKIPLPQHSSKNDMDLIAINQYEAFVVWHIINGRPPSGKFSAGTLPTETTSRFYHTLTKILNAAKA